MVGRRHGEWRAVVDHLRSTIGSSPPHPQQLDQTATSVTTVTAMTLAKAAAEAFLTRSPSHAGCSRLRPVAADAAAESCGGGPCAKPWCEAAAEAAVAGSRQASTERGQRSAVSERDSEHHEGAAPVGGPATRSSAHGANNAPSSRVGNEALTDRTQRQCRICAERWRYLLNNKGIRASKTSFIKRPASRARVLGPAALRESGVRFRSAVQEHIQVSCLRTEGRAAARTREPHLDRFADQAHLLQPGVEASLALRCAPPRTVSASRAVRGATGRDAPQR